MNYNFTEEKFQEYKKLAETTYCNSKVLKAFCSISNEESIYYIKPIVDEIKQKADLLAALFIEKEDPCDT